MKKFLLPILLSLIPIPVRANSIFPHIVLGGTTLEYKVELQISNMSGGAMDGEFSISPTGLKRYWEGEWSVNGVPKGDHIVHGVPKGVWPVHSVDKIPSRGSRTYTLTGDSQTRTGTLRINGFVYADDRQVISSAFLRVYKHGKLIDSVGILPFYPSHIGYDGFIVPVHYRKGEFDTGVAWVFHGTIEGVRVGYWVEVHLFDNNGKRVDMLRLFLTEEWKSQASLHEAKFLSEYFPEVSNKEKFIGSLHFYTPFGYALIGMGLRLDYVQDGIQLTTIPVRAVER